MVLEDDPLVIPPDVMDAQGQQEDLQEPPQQRPRNNGNANAAAGGDNPNFDPDDPNNQ